MSSGREPIKRTIESRPIVTLITVTYNSAAYLERTITSVISQDYEPIDYVIIDGGSTDGTLAIIRKYEPWGIRWLSEPDRGISDAFNKGIHLAKGAIIGIVSSDDWLASKAVTQVVAAFNRNPQADVVYGDIVFVDTFTGTQVRVRPDADLRAVWLRQPVKHAAMFTTRHAYALWGEYSGSYQYAMDYELVLRFHLGGAEFVYIDAPLAHVCPGGRSYTSLYETVNETRLIVQEHGMSAWKARSLFVYKLIRVYLRALLLRPSLSPLIALYRRRGRRFLSVPDD